MALNTELWDALNKPNLGQVDGYEKALDAIIAVDIPENINDQNNEAVKSFRRALIENKTLWKTINPAFNISNDAKDTSVELLTIENVILNAYGQPFGIKLPNLRRLAAQQRIVFGLQKKDHCDADYLQSIVAAPDNDALRAILTNDKGIAAFGNLSSEGWKEGRVLADNELGIIKLQAQKQLLIRKIDECKDRNKITALFPSAAKDVATFQMAVENLGLPKNIANNVTPDAFKYEDVKHAAALKAGILWAENSAESEWAKDAPGLWMQKVNDGNNDYYKSFANQDFDIMKGILGQRFLTEYFSTSDTDNLENLIAIAGTADPAICQNIIEAVIKGAENFSSSAVTDKTLTSLRLAAAERVLQLKIASCEEIATLERLISAPDSKGIKSILSNNEYFGFKGNETAINALDAAEKSVINDFRIAALVRTSFLNTTDITKLQTFIKTPGPELFKDNFAPGMDSSMILALKAYFRSSEKQAAASKQAWIALFRLHAKSLDLDSLNAVTDLVSLENLASTLAGVTGVSTQGFTPDLTKILVAYVTAQKYIKEADTFDLTNENDFNTLLGYIKTGIEDLPSVDLAAQKEALVKILIKNYPLAADHARSEHLTKLAVAINKEAFVKALKSLGLEDKNLSWVNEKNYNDLRAEANKALFPLRLMECSPFNSTIPHQELAAIFNQLSPQKQRELLAQPPVNPAAKSSYQPNLNLVALMLARTAIQVRDILGPLQPDASKLVAENQRLALIGRIANAGIAKVLAEMPGINLTLSAVEEINAILTEFANLEPETLLKDVFNDLFRIIDDKGIDKEAFYEAFGLNATGTEVKESAIPEAIGQQHGYNSEIIGLIDTVNTTQPIDFAKIAALSIVMQIQKNKDFIDPDLSTLLEIFEDATSYNDFIEKLVKATEGYNRRPQVPSTRTPDFVAPSIKTLPADWKKYIRPEEIEAYLLLRNKRKLFADVNKVDETLLEMKAAIESMRSLRSDLKTLDKKIGKDIDNIVKTDAMDWLNPEFQAAAQLKAFAMTTKYSFLAKNCDYIFEELSIQKMAYEQQLQTLPQDADLEAKEADGTITKQQKKAFKSYRHTLEKELKEINKLYQRYQLSSQILNGNPEAAEGSLMHEGIVKRLENAKNERADVRFQSYGRMQVVYHPRDKKEELLNKTVAELGNIPAEPVAIALDPKAGGKKNYTVELMTSEQKGQIAEYTMDVGTVAKADKASFIVEYGKDHLAPQTKDGKYVNAPSLQVTVCKPPTSEEGKVKYYMAMAMMALGGAAHPPTAKMPVCIPGDNLEQVRAIYAALAIVMKASPHLKFDKDAIKITGRSGFHPDSELSTFYGFHYGFHKDAQYKKYEESPSAQAIIRDIKSFSKEKEKADDKFFKSYDSVRFAYKTFLQEKSKELMKDIDDSYLKHSPKPH